MRILVLNYEYPPLGGGAAVATAALAQGLVERGILVDVVTAGAGAERRESMAGREQLESPGLTLYRVKSRRRGIHEAGMGDAATYLIAALPLIRRLLRTYTYDAVHVFFSLPTGALLPFLNLKGIPVVVSLRGSDVPGYDPHNRALQLSHWILAPLTRWIWRRADHVVAVCESLGQLARRTYPGLRYTVVPNGVDLNLFHPWVGSRPSPAGRIRCIAVARLIERKGLGDLIRALALLERGRFQLDIVGGGPDEQVLRDLATGLGVAQDIHFSGPLDRPEVARRYREADLFTLPSSAEAFGNVFAEALASGLPIVGSRVGGIPDLVEHGTNGLLVPSGDVAALAGAIKYLADDPQLREEMAQRNRAKAESNLQWSQVTRRYLSTYEGTPHRAPARSLVAEPTASVS
ncbi:MAG TPA: glycosyltransferase family 4 protein [Gemmatimonadales bacterium]|nr:glycosyltransferase family 4 protein [Gemmatimonadales bacterium]